MNNKALTLLIFLSASALFICAENGPVGAKSNALGKISVLAKDLWATENNPAALAYQKTISGGISYKSPFLLNELSTKSALFSLPIESGTFGLYIHQFGYTEYSENKLGLSYGQQLSENISLGIQLNYLHTQIKESSYKNTAALSGTIGILAKVSEKFTLGAAIINPNRAKRANYRDERYPSIIKMGVAYLLSEKVSLLTEIEKDIENSAQAKFGIEYLPTEILYLRTGYASNPSTIGFGFGLLLNDFTLDFSSSFHSTLGFNPEISLSFNIDRKR